MGDSNPTIYHSPDFILGFSVFDGITLCVNSYILVSYDVNV